MPTFVPHFEELYLVYCGAKTIISIYNKQDRLALQLRVKDKIVDASGRSHDTKPGRAQNRFEAL